MKEDCKMYMNHTGNTSFLRKNTTTCTFHDLVLNTCLSCKHRSVYVIIQGILILLGSMEIKLCIVGSVSSVGIQVKLTIDISINIQLRMEHTNIPAVSFPPT